MGRKVELSSKKAVAYLRVSTQGQKLGLEAQLTAVESWCNAKGVELVAVYQEKISGGAAIDKRLSLMAAVGGLSSHGAGLLIVGKRDRLARDTLSAAMIERLVAKKGGTIISADGVGNGETPEAQLFKNMLDAFAQYERAAIKGRIKAALAKKKEKGERIGGIPYGYQLAADGMSLEANPEEKRVLRLVKELRGMGQSMRAITDKLNAGNHPARGEKWHLTSVARLIKRAA
jgi:site-specific DNA recombinase